MDVEGTIVGYYLPTIDGPEMYVPLNPNAFVREVRETAQGGAVDVGLEVYSYKELSAGELADAQEYASKSFGSEALRNDVVGHMGKLPAIQTFIGGAIWGGLAILSKSPLMGYWAIRDAYSGYKYLKDDLRGCQERKRVAEDLCLNMDAVAGKDAAMAEKLKGLGTYFDGLHGTEKEIYAQMEAEAGRLGMDAAKEFYHEKLQDASRVKKGFFEAIQKAGKGIARTMTGNYDLLTETKPMAYTLREAPTRVEGEPKEQGIREIPVYLLPSKAGYDVYVDESPDMYFLLNDRADARVKLSIRTPVELSKEQVAAIEENFVSYVKDTIYMGNKLQHYTEEAQYTKGWKLGRILNDGLGAFFLYRGLSGVISKGIPGIEPFQAAIGGNMIISTELIESQKNKRMAEHTRELIAGVDTLHDRIVGVEQVRHAGLEHMEEVMKRYDTAEEAYINAFNDAKEVGLGRFEGLYHRMALSQQWTVSDQRRGIMTLEREDEKDGGEV